MSHSITRRECLQLGAAAILGSRLAAIDKPAPAITFGFSLYGMKSLPLEEALSSCSKIGYDAVELALMPGYHADPAKFDKITRKKTRERLAEMKLTLPALMENLPPDVDDAKHKGQLDRLKAACELGRDLAPDMQPVIETILGGKVDQWDNLKDHFAKRLVDWAKLAEAEKTVICIKPHRMNAMNLPEHVKWLIDRVGSSWLRVAYDWSHYERRNLTMKGTMESLIPLTRFVHVKDTIFEKDLAKFVLPGEGETDYGELLKLLKEQRYVGCVCVEVSGMVSSKKDYDPIAAAKKCYEKLAPAFGRK